MCLPKFWFLSLNKQIHLLVPEIEEEQARNTLQELADIAGVMEQHPFEDEEEFPEEPRDDAEPDFRTPRLLAGRFMMWLVLLIMYHFVHAFWMRMM